MTLWSRWIAFTGREVDSRPLRLVRVLVPLCILGDLLAIVWRGAFRAVLLPESMGGLTDGSSWWSLFGGVWWGGPLLWVLCLVAAPLVIRGGRLGRPALATLLVAYAQLGHLYTPGDRAIDRLLRTVLLLWLFSEASSARPASRIAAWPADLLRWLLAIVYLQAGIVKINAKPGFLDLDMNELYQIMCAPQVGRLDPVFWEPLMPLFFVGGVVTMMLEFSSPLLLTRLGPYWAIGGALMHIGIAIGMDLGMFPFGMLALYPVLLWPFTIRALDALAPWLPESWGPPDYSAS